MKLVCVWALVVLQAAASNRHDAPRFLEDVKEEEDVTYRIVGGTQSTPSRFPYFTRVDENGRPHCGGTLIHSDIVLTAAHCVLSRSRLSTVVNAFVTSGYYTGQLDRSIQNTFVHPNYNKDTKEYDFAIIKLSKPVFSVTPLSLNDDFSEPGIGDTLTVMGIGLNAEDGDLTMALNQVAVQAIGTSTCNRYYDGAIRSSMFCAGVTFGGKDSCQGDSGGPIVQTRNGIDVLVGLVSWGIGCARAQNPGVYARVSSAKSWIDSTICSISSYPNAGCPGVPRVPIPTPAPASTLAPTLALSQSSGSCFDDDTTPFRVSILGSKRCSWLRDRKALQRSLCHTGHAAYKICAATCGKCSKDVCTDSTDPIIIRGISRDCQFVARKPKVLGRECMPGGAAYDMCPKTCDTCSNGKAVTSLMEPTPSPVVTPPAAPALRSEGCADSVSTQFYVQGIDQKKDCVWLAAQGDYINTYCTDKHYSTARDACPETCGKCANTCEDTIGKFEIDGIRRDCLWLSLRTSEQDKVCLPDNKAWSHCRETCGNCVLSSKSVDNSRVRERCADDRFGSFFVNSHFGDKGCNWLATTPDWQAILCVDGHDSQASEVCALTCGKCRDKPTRI